MHLRPFLPNQTVGERLAIAGLNVAYGRTEFPTNGPFLKSVTAKARADGSISAVVRFDQSFSYSPQEGKSGFYYCEEEDPTSCDDEAEFWMEVRKTG